MTIDTVCETTGVHLDGNFSAGHYEIRMPDDDCMSYQIKELKPELETESIFGEGLTMETISGKGGIYGKTFRYRGYAWWPRYVKIK